MQKPLSLSLGLTLALSLAAQKRPPGTIVAGDLGQRCEAAVFAAAPNYWGSVLVAQDDKVVFARGFGPVDRKFGPRMKEMSSKSLFDLGGAAGWLTAILALRLEADGRFRLDDPVGKYLPGWPAAKAEMTIDHLLLHTSGLPRDARWNGGSAKGTRPAIAEIGSVESVARPGAQFSYSVLNGILLALVCEEAAGERYDKLLESRVLKPFGMKTAGPTSSRFDKKLVTIRQKEGSTVGEPADQLEYNWRQRGARAVLASVHDVHALLEQVFAGDAFDARQRGLLLRPIAQGSMRLGTIDVGDSSLVRVDGYSGGFRTSWTVHAPSRSWVVQFTAEGRETNAVEAALIAELAKGWQSIATASEPEPAAEPAAGESKRPAGSGAGPAGSREWQERFVGTFGLPGGGAFRIERRDGRLCMSGSGLQASVRIQEGAWPGATGGLARQSEDRGLSLLARLLQGDATVIDEAFADAAAADAASTLLAALLADHGALQRLEFIGTALTAKPVRSWFRIVCERGAGVVGVDWLDTRRFARCAVAEQETPFVVDLDVGAADLATARALGGRPLRLSIEGRGDRRVLVFEDSTPGEAGLIDCPLVPN